MAHCFEMIDELRGNPDFGNWSCFKLLFERSHGVDILLPDGEQELDIESFAHCLS